MTKIEAARRTALENALMTLGFTRDESVAMFRDVIRQHGYCAFPVRVAS